MRSSEKSNGVVLVIGATGYVGGRLVERLEQKGFRLRCLVRNPARLRSRVLPTTGIVQADLLDRDSLDSVMDEVEVVVYLAHSSGLLNEGESHEAQAAHNLVGATGRAEVLQKIVYLGVLGPAVRDVRHVRSRRQVGAILRDSGVPTVELRSSIILGSGSVAFEILRGLVDRLPVVPVPRWARTWCQPIAVEDVLKYLMAAIELKVTSHEIYEIGGSQPVQLFQVMREYARQLHLRRLFLPLPFFAGRLSSWIVGLATPVYARVAYKFIESVRHDAVVTDDLAGRVLGVEPRTLHASVRRTLAREDRDYARTRWSDPLSSIGVRRQWDEAKLGKRFFETREVVVRGSARQAFAILQTIGGSSGWFGADWLWKLRGLIDRLLGGPGLRRGRTHPTMLHRGDTVDFWRVEELHPPHLLRLIAEMRLPGRAWLQFEVTERENTVGIRLTALFDPAGLAGLLYWYSLKPIHHYVFLSLLEGVVIRVHEAQLARLVPEAGPLPASD